jgi:integrase
MDIDFPYLHRMKNRHGNARWYVRMAGRRIQIKATRGTPEFARAYASAIETLKSLKGMPVVMAGRRRFPPGTFGWLGAKYFGSDEFQRLDAKSQATRRGVLEACFEEPHSDDDAEPMGYCPLQYFSPQKVKRLRDLKAGRPGAQNNRRKYLSAMFGWAIAETPALWTKANPARDVRRARYATDGFHTWTADEVHQFEERHPVGTQARLALALLLFLGVRGSDLVTLGRQHVKDGWLRFVPAKTRYKRMRVSEKPILPVLTRIIAASTCGEMTFLVTQYGRPFSRKGFGNKMREWCDQAGLPQCTAHGLRKAGATIAAEKGATVHQLMAIFDWDTPAQAKVYTDAADRKRLAAQAMPLLAPASDDDDANIQGSKTSHPRAG